MTPAALRLSTTLARERLSEIVRRVQDPRAYCVLTRHGKPVAAVVSMAELSRIFDAHDIERLKTRGWAKAWPTALSGKWPSTARETGEMLLKVQMDRLSERRLLARAGLDPIPGGEVAVEVEVPVRRRWFGWRR